MSECKSYLTNKDFEMLRGSLRNVGAILDDQRTWRRARSVYEVNVYESTVDNALEALSTAFVMISEYLGTFTAIEDKKGYESTKPLQKYQGGYGTRDSLEEFHLNALVRLRTRYEK